VNSYSLPDNRCFVDKKVGQRVDQKNPSHAEAWFRYADDLGLGPYFLDRTVSLSASSVTGPVTSPIASPVANQVADSMAASKVSPVIAPISAHAAELPVVPAAQAMSAGAAAPSGGYAAPSPALKRPSIVAPPADGFSLFDERIEGDTLVRIADDIGPACTRCKLHKARKKIVFGVGNPKAELVFVGEGPGRDEDEQGEPFVGRAGKLLTQMIEAMSLRREDVYIANVVKCRPPENRLPEKDEIATCSPYLMRQLAVIGPKVICCLGSCSAQTLLQTTQGISRFRGEWFDFRGSKLIATYHPAYLLRNPNAKGEVWKDLQKVMALLGLKPKRR
jgi:uracil-DNA glycosylase family 4